jgi:hypothetical protein
VSPPLKQGLQKADMQAFTLVPWSNPVPARGGFCRGRFRQAVFKKNSLYHSITPINAKKLTGDVTTIL